ncbi:MAG: flagellar protein export ATPase FliI [Alphaproteobacteria bacterium]|nr:flagellar protein export ATPase FliI [Alphaproteobacteria bacterium]
MEHILSEIERLRSFRLEGHVTAVMGLLIECSGIEHGLTIGARCHVHAKDKRDVVCEVVGFREERALLMPFGSPEGVGPGSKVVVTDAETAIYPDESWLGRVVNAFAEPIDGLGRLRWGRDAFFLRQTPDQSHLRQRVGGKLDIGVRSVNTFLTCCQGQRMGIFAGSGVGKSVLMSMFARNSQADVNVIGLIGERSREVQEFIEDDLGEEGLKRSVVVAATSSESALMRRQAAYVTMALAEYFREQGKEVLCLMDSVTRFAMAQREIGLSAGEPPTSKGYTPTVFSELPKLLERAGPGMKGEGAITGMFSVLVEGDDTNEPISDTVRGIIDGHIMLDRSIAQRGRFPAINVLKSISRMMPGCNTEAQNALVARAKQLMATYDDMAEMIRLGAYRKGSDPDVDMAIKYHEPLEAFIKQQKDEYYTLEEGYQQLAELLDMPYESGGEAVGR